MPPVECKIGDEKISIEISLREALNYYRTKGIPLLGLLHGDTIETCVKQVMFNDELMLEVLEYQCQKNNIAFSELQENLEMNDLRRFKERFWEAIENFTDPQLKPILQQALKVIKDQIRKISENPNLLKQSLSMEENPE